jgi:dTDP-4-dehydrorhamnose 3,5-epimerase
MFKFSHLSAQAYGDDRGYLQVLYEVGDVVLKRSFSRAGVFRGMHRQRYPSLQTKLIRVISGRIIDFVFDPSLDLPEIFYKEVTNIDGWIQIESHLAHGFYALEDVEFEYLCHGAYNESSEESFSIAEFLKEKMRISDLILSPKDRAAKPIDVVDGMNNA